MPTNIHERHGVGVSCETLPDGRRKVTIVDTVGELNGVHASFILPARKNSVTLFGRAIVRIDYYEKVLKRLLRDQTRSAKRTRTATKAKVNPSAAILRLVK